MIFQINLFKSIIEYSGLINSQILYSTSFLSYEIKNCHIFSFTNKAVFLSSSLNIELLCQDTLFFECSSNSNGGALFFSGGTNSKSMIQRICGYKCFLTTIGQGSFFSITTGTFNENFAFFISYSYCSDINRDIDGSSRLVKGYQNFSYCNSSNNFIYYRSGFNFRETTKSECKFTTISNCYSSKWTILELHEGISNLSYINFINNRHSSTSRGLIELRASSTSQFLNCIIFNSDLYTFYIYSGTLYLKNCYFNSLSFLGASVLNEEPLINSKTFILIHFQSYFCETNIKLVSIHNFKFFNFKIFLILLILN